MTLLRAYFLVVALVAPGTVSPALAVHDWTPRITEPSSFDWCGRVCLSVPSLGVHRIERGR